MHSQKYRREGQLLHRTPARFWLVNFSRRQTQMRVVCKDEVVRQVEVRYHYQVEDKASFFCWRKNIFPSVIWKHLASAKLQKWSTETDSYPGKKDRFHPQTAEKITVWYHGQLLDLNLGTNTRSRKGSSGRLLKTSGIIRFTMKSEDGIETVCLTINHCTQLLLYTVLLWVMLNKSIMRVLHCQSDLSHN